MDSDGEGIHKPLGRFMFNNIQFGKHDPLVPLLKEAGYNVFNHPTDDSGILVTFPVEYANVPFHIVDGKEVNLDTAVEQLNRYKLLQDNWSNQNTSVTISYSVDEIPDIIDWLLINWDCYVGVSFLYRNDPTKTAKDLGYPYLPQEVVTKEVYDEYVSQLGEIDLDRGNSFDEIVSDECASGACPIR
jgi:ribonucleoside-triphosphate reductase